MQPELIIALLLTLPIALLMAVFVLYLNIGRIYISIKDTLEKRTWARENPAKHISTK